MCFVDHNRQVLPLIVSVIIYECRASQYGNDDHFEMRMLSKAAHYLLDRYSHMDFSFTKDPPDEPDELDTVVTVDLD